MANRSLGLRGAKFRRYGVQGQAQHGIDLAGREPDDQYTVVQCKEYQVFTAADLRAAVETFTTGRRPFDAHCLIVATSASTQTTQVADELGRLRSEHPDLELELWGAEQINDLLRPHGDVVAQFWTRETAVQFCTGAPLPGVPVPPLDRQEQALRILIGPLRTDDVAPALRQAEEQRSTNPEEAARAYADLARQLDEAGFRGHGGVLRGKQVDALQLAGRPDEAAELAAQLAVTALNRGEWHESRELTALLEKLAGQAESAGTEHSPHTRRHSQLLSAAVISAFHPLGDFSALQSALEIASPVKPAYQPLLVLLLAENRLATDPERLQELDPLVREAITAAQSEPVRPGLDTVLRLRLVRAAYDATERTQLLWEARRHQMSGRHAALVQAREARRCALEGQPEEAVEGWRNGVHDGIHAGLTEEAAEWLYAIRAVNVRYGPWLSNIDDEHRLAQALRATGTGCLLERARPPREHALSALKADRPSEAAQCALRWLTDTVITADWAGEIEALEFLGDLYCENQEPVLAAMYYMRAGETSKAKKLAAAVGDLPLTMGPINQGPWWVMETQACLLEVQADLIRDDAAGIFLDEMTALAVRGRAGELAESPLGELTRQATQSACVLAARGTPAQAQAVLDLLAPDVPREPNRYRDSDDGHASACYAIAVAHPSLAAQALTRLFDLAERSVDKANRLLADGNVCGMLADGQSFLGEEDKVRLRQRVSELDQLGISHADVAHARIDPDHSLVRSRAEQARDRILQRPCPQPGSASFGTNLTTDSYLVSKLHQADRGACLTKVLEIAADANEVALNRKEALTAARNLLFDAPLTVRQRAFRTAQSFVGGAHDGSYLDELSGAPHPLGFFRISFGSASLRGEALVLASAAAEAPVDHAWVRDQAISMLSTDSADDLQAAARVLNWLPKDEARRVDASLLATHQYVAVRQVSALLCLRDLGRFYDTAVNLTKDPDYRVRLILAQSAAKASCEGSLPAKGITELLSADPRYCVRAAARAAQ
ncbi:hypothetical protein ACIPLC_00645 [Kitasatospora sp. NPDC086801]|uniref:hypothetical protein n=1 Tax=Kitasatospora sp. NPDC086801 TaxID=3364066 RepID=UPI00381F0236